MIKKKKCVLFCILICILILFNFMIFYFKNTEILSTTIKSKKGYSELESDECEIIIQDKTIFDNHLNVDINLKKYDKDNSYILQVKNNSKQICNEQLQDSKQSINLTIDNIVEGKNELQFDVFNGNNNIISDKYTIYYIKPYTKQFLDNLSPRGVTCHLDGNFEVNEKSILYAKNVGISNIKTDFGIQLVYNKNTNKFNYSYFNKLEKLADENDINLVFVLGGLNFISSNNKFPNNENEFNISKKYFTEAINCLNTEEYEVLNEPNLIYTNEEDYKKYAELVSIYGKNNNTKRKLIVGSLAQPTSVSDPYEFLDRINSETYKYAYGYSFHYYANCNVNVYSSAQKKYNEEFNKCGGFLKKYVIEHGYSTQFIGGENAQALAIVRESIINDDNNVNRSYSYNFVNTKFRGDSDSIKVENNYGILTNDYEPKKAYYALKNLNTNINGSEYIGSFTLQDGITAYVYDKDGKPKIIIWSNDGNKKLDYKDFKASDLYGNEISADENNQLTVSDSPIYLDNVSTNYFYKAISNSITNGYYEFNTKFADEIAKVDGLTAKINNLNNQAVNLKNVSTFDENKANELMKEHFELGNMIMSAYEDGKLNVEYVKLSSMLDSLNTIGNSFEDLVTVSAKTRITDLTDIKNEVNTAKSLAQDNEKFDIVYPNKIYQFAQDFIDTSSYILGLEEENDIKTGLINSKALHAKYLAELSQRFSKIYMKDALKNSINNISNNNEKIEGTNKSVLANKDISNIYNKQEQLLQNILNNPEKNNIDIINQTFDNQINISNCIIKKYINKEINISSNELYEILNNEFNNLNNYSELYQYYLNEDNIDNKEVETKLNKVIDRYNNNLDIDLNSEAKIINNIKDIYDNKINSESISDNYLNKLIINKNTELVSQLIENKIKNTADKEFQTINIEDCDLNKITNKDVNVKLKLPNAKAQITNNDGKESVQFTQNGEFTFDINIRGYDYQYKVKVNNIDKESPKVNIKNINNTLSASATDDNLMEINIEKDGKKVGKNKNITEPGIYKVSAIDKANNQSIEKTIIFGNYQENNENKKYIPINKIETKAKEIKGNSNFIIKENGQDVEDDSLIKTGDTLINNNQSYTLIVKGDLTNSGKADVLSLIKLRKVLVSIDNLDGIGKIAADLNDDDNIDVIDLIMLRKKIVGIE